MALSHMLISEVEKQFKRIRALSSPSLDDLFVYFERQWIKVIFLYHYGMQVKLIIAPTIFRNV